jgi:hypothetical protein
MLTDASEDVRGHDSGAVNASEVELDHDFRYSGRVDASVPGIIRYTLMSSWSSIQPEESWRSVLCPLDGVHLSAHEWNQLSPHLLAVPYVLDPADEPPDQWLEDHRIEMQQKCDMQSRSCVRK